MALPLLGLQVVVIPGQNWEVERKVEEEKVDMCYFEKKIMKKDKAKKTVKRHTVKDARAKKAKAKKENKM